LIQVKILYALRDIKNREEICFSYLPLVEIFGNGTPDYFRQLLKYKWGIVCDQNCLCFDKTYIQKLNYRKELHKQIFLTKSFPAVALNYAKSLLELEEELNMLQARMKVTLYVAFVHAIGNAETVELGVGYITEAYELAKRIAHPEHNEDVKMYKKFMEDPSSHKAFWLNNLNPEDILEQFFRDYVYEMLGFVPDESSSDEDSD